MTTTDVVSAVNAPSREWRARTEIRRVAVALALPARAVPGALALYAVVTIGTGAVPVLIAWLTKQVLDDLVRGAALGSLLTTGGFLVAAGAVTGVAPHLTQYLRGRIQRDSGLLAQQRLFTAVEGFIGLARFENPHFLDRLRLAEQAGRTSVGQAVEGILGAGKAVLTVVGFLGSLLVLSPMMAALVLGSGVPTLVAALALSHRRAGVFWRLGPVERREIFYSELLSSVQAAKEVRLFGLGRFFRERMLTERRTANDAQRDMDRRELVVQIGLAALAAAVSGAGLLWAVAAARAGTLSIGGVTMFVAAVAGVQGALAALTGTVAAAHRAMLMLDHYLAVLATGPDLPEPVPAQPVPPLRHGIELRDVWFRYSEEHPWVLRGVDLWIPRGSAVALVGLNGAGKSTLVKLLCRFYDPTRGAVLWDGVDLRDLDAAQLRQRMSAVFQDYMHYELTAAENIGLGDLDRFGDRPRIEAAASDAGLHDTIAALPRAYDTLLSRRFFTAPHTDEEETGVVLSGGQWQRLALARAVLRDRRDLMILDEPSAGLDAEAEHEVHTRLRQHRQGGTSLLISHRLGAVRDADTIVVLAEGRIVERGDHATLMAAAGHYARLFTVQAAGYRADGGGESGTTEHGGRTSVPVECGGRSGATAERGGRSSVPVERGGRSSGTVERGGRSSVPVEYGGRTNATAGRGGQSNATAERGGRTSNAAGQPLVTSSTDEGAA